MVDDDGSIVVRDWVVGFALGIGLRAQEWGKRILLTQHRQALIPILVYCEGELDLLPDMPAAEKRRRQATAHVGIAPALPPAPSAIPIAPPKPAGNRPDHPAPAVRAGSAHKARHRRSSRPTRGDSAPLTANLKFK